MADSRDDAKQALQDRRKALLDKAEAAVPGVENLDGLPHLVTRRIFRLPIVKTPADLKAIVMGSVGGIVTFFVLLSSLAPGFWPVYVLVSLLVVVKVNSDFTQGDGIEVKPIKPQRKASKAIADVVWAGPHSPLENRLTVVHRGREVSFEAWFDQEVESKDRRSHPRAGGA